MLPLAVPLSKESAAASALLTRVKRLKGIISSTVSHFPGRLVHWNCYCALCVAEGARAAANLATSTSGGCAHGFPCTAAGALSRANSSAKRLSLGSRKPSHAALPQDGQLIRAEGRAVGRVKRTIYKTYLSAWGPFFLVPISMFSIALVERALQVR